MNTKQFATSASGNQWAYSLDNGCTFRACPTMGDAIIKAREAINHRFKAGVASKFILIEITRPITHVHISKD